MTHPVRTAADTVDANVTDGGITQTLLEALVKRTALVLGPTESLGAITQSAGEIALAVIHGAHGNIYFYDETDSTTPDDGFTCLVDGSGHRYIIENMASVSLSSVLAEQNTPPVSPASGDAYIVGTAPTGTWAAQAKKIAVYTKRGWVYATPMVGHAVLNETTGGNLQYSAAGSWVGLSPTLAAEDVHPEHILFPLGIPATAEQNTPPVSPSSHEFYIVGGSPTGDWVGHSAEVAFYEDATWKFIAPYEGATVYLASADAVYKFSAGTWSNAAGNIGTWTTVKKTADEAITNDTTASADAELKFPVEANQKYAFRAVLFVNGNTGGLKFGLNGPSAPSRVNWGFTKYTGGPSLQAVVGDYETAYSTSGITASLNDPAKVEIFGIVHNGVNAGDVSVMWAQQTLSGSATTVYAGSHIEYMRV